LVIERFREGIAPSLKVFLHGHLIHGLISWSRALMANKLDDARRSLVRAKESTRARLQAIDDERRELKASLKSLDAALKALGPSSRQQPSLVDDRAHGPASEQGADVV
jgi:hypothetical protein